MVRTGSFSELWQPVGPAAPGELPARVLALVRRRDRQSEYLLCCAQLLLAGTLSLLYTIAPRPADASMTQLAPVPIALTLYVCFIAVRIWLVVRQPSQRWIVAASIAADMALLLGLIWSFQWTYSQPPAFSLKAPTFVYIFVFISVRALRFDYRYVLIAGCAAALGWLLLSAVAIYVSPPGTITRNFTSYILSNHILIGAEFDKIFAIICVTGLLGLAAWRSERTLVEALREQTANREIGRFLSHGVADQIARSAFEIQAGDVTEREAAIMFLDIRGFTRLATSMPPETLVSLLTSFHRHVVPIVRARNGVIDKFLGDGVMVTFGAARPSSRPAADALQALEEILLAMKPWQAEVSRSGLSEPLRVNGAVAAGRVVFAALGDNNRLEYTVIGEAVNLAAKLEKHNKAEGTVALTPFAIYTLAGEQGFVPTLVPHIRKNVRVGGVDAETDLVCWLKHGEL